MGDAARSSSLAALLIYLSTLYRTCTVRVACKDIRYFVCCSHAYEIAAVHVYLNAVQVIAWVIFQTQTLIRRNVSFISSDATRIWCAVWSVQPFCSSQQTAKPVAIVCIFL